MKIPRKKAAAKVATTSGKAVLNENEPTKAPEEFVPPADLAADNNWKAYRPRRTVYVTHLLGPAVIGGVEVPEGTFVVADGETVQVADEALFLADFEPLGRLK